MSEKQAWIIPDDWDGEKWLSVCLRWPDSKQWGAILIDLIHSLTRGRNWDRDTGSIKDTQLIGWAIFNRLMEWKSCCDGEGGSPPVSPEVIKYILMDDGEGDCDMGCGSACLRVNDATGEIEQLVCGEWRALEHVNSPSVGDGVDVGDPETPVPGDDEGVNQNVKCRVAYMIASAMWRVHSVIFDQLDDVLPIPVIGFTVRGELPEYTLDAFHIYQAVVDAFLVTDTADFDLVFGTESEQVPDLAAWMMRFLAESYTIDRLHYEAVAVGLAPYSFHEGVELNVGQFLEGMYWSHIFRALGKGTINDLAAQARSLTSEQFDCHEKPVVVPPEIADVHWTGGLFVNFKPPEMNNPSLVLSPDKSVATVTLSGDTGIAYTDFRFSLGLVSTVNLSSIDIKFEVDSPTNDWHTPAIALFGDMQPGVIVNATTVATLIAGGEGQSFATYRYAFEGLPLGFGWPDESHSYRINPRDVSAPFERKPKLTIVGWVAS